MANEICARIYKYILTEMTNRKNNGMGSFFIKINVKIKRLPLTLAPKDPLGPEISRNRSNFLCGFWHLTAVGVGRYSVEPNDFHYLLASHVRLSGAKI